MKIWRFYLKPKEGTRVAENEFKYSHTLYALTQEKKLAKRFEKERDMSQFILRSDGIDSELGDEFLVSNRAKLLTEDYIETIVEQDDYSQPAYINVLHTDNELEYMRHVVDTNAIYSTLSGYLPMEIFTEEIREILYKLHYHKVIEHLQLGLGNCPDGIVDVGMQYDMFNLYMLLYGKYYKPDYIKHCVCKTEQDLTEEDWIQAVHSFD